MLGECSTVGGLARLEVGVDGLRGLDCRVQGSVEPVADIHLTLPTNYTVLSSALLAFLKNKSRGLSFRVCVCVDLVDALPTPLPTNTTRGVSSRHPDLVD